MMTILNTVLLIILIGQVNPEIPQSTLWYVFSITLTVNILLIIIKDWLKK